MIQQRKAQCRIKRGGDSAEERLRRSLRDCKRRGISSSVPSIRNEPYRFEFTRYSLSAREAKKSVNVSVRPISGLQGNTLQDGGGNELLFSCRILLLWQAVFQRFFDRPAHTPPALILTTSSTQIIPCQTLCIVPNSLIIIFAFYPVWTISATNILLTCCT